MAQPEFHEVELDGMRFLATNVQVTNLSVFQGKVIIGDPTKDNHPLLSTWVINDLSGGHGVAKLTMTDLNRYRFGTIYTRYPNQFVLPRLVREYVVSTSSYLLGDRWLGTDFDHYSLQDTSDFYHWNETLDQWTFNTAAAGLVPVGPGVAFQGTGARRIVVPEGTNGYFTWTGGTLVDSATPTFVSFCLWDDKLIGIDDTGQLHSTTDGTTWTSYVTAGKLDASYAPKHVLVYRDRSDAPAIHVVTNRDVWAFDPAGPSLYRIDDLSFPGGPEGGNGACVWRGDLYVSTGMGVFRYNGATVAPVGLDRDDGIPAAYRQAIVWLWPESNGLYALVRGSSGGNQTLSVHVFTGFGWHCEWAMPTADAVAEQLATWGYTSQGNNGYRLWWGTHGDDPTFYTIELPRDFANPRAAVESGSNQFAAGLHYLETGRFDAGMRGYDKIANAVHVTVSNYDVGDVITVKYRVDGAAAFTTLGTANANGRTTLLFGTPNADGHNPGVTFDDIELRLEMTRASGSAFRSPIVEDLVLSFLKVVKPSNSWVMDLDLTTPHAGTNPDTLYAKLETLLGAGTFFTMKHRDETFRTRIAQMTAQDETGP